MSNATSFDDPFAATKYSVNADGTALGIATANAVIAVGWTSAGPT